MTMRYAASGVESEFEPGSRGRVLRNRFGIRRVGEMQQAESVALDAAQEWALRHFDAAHRFTAADVCELHRQWLGGIYTWAGDYRSVNITKSGFMFAAAAQVPRLMADFSRKELAQETPCDGMDTTRLARVLARTHAELILIHPFREGNGRCARLLAWLMALQAGVPPLAFSNFSGYGKRAYIAGIHAAMTGDYARLGSVFELAIRRTSSFYSGQV
ncbi:MAG TPA: Fic family protein [Rudaea sp.]|jgi:cell filamentation protein|uniref:Fic/DOC family protein n=1 Tax=Rudaea sp. TaxID=2136325 RepID=UPI002F95BDF1